jgi:hypothetical protein
MILTKSKFLAGEQCPRLLWFTNKKELPEINIQDQHKFNQGSLFEEQAHKLFPEAVNLTGKEFKDNLALTEKAIVNKKIIFEAGILQDNYYIRADVLDAEKKYLYEIKATTEVKRHHLPDLAFQRFVLRKQGIMIERCFIIHLNKEFVKNGEIDPKEICTIEDVTDEVEAVRDVEQHAQKALKVLRLEEAPEVPISKKCRNPYVCPLKDKCWNSLPEHNVLQLKNWRVYWDLFNQEIIDLKEIPKEVTLNRKDEIIRTGALTGETQINKEVIEQFVDSLNFPLYHFDFETFDTAVPIYDKSKPYQKIAFQYSLHIQQENGDLKHFEYLATGEEDPRIKLLSTLKDQIAGTGDVIVFNKSFEISVFAKLAEDFPEHKDWIVDVIERIVDLASPFGNFDYYDPSQKGSYSLKKILPALTGVSYSSLEINNGGVASALYFYTHIVKDMDKDIRKDLLKYCCLDTEGMVWIVDKLKGIV